MPLSIGVDLEDSLDLRDGEIAQFGISTDILTGVNADTVVLPFGRGVIFATATGTHERARLTLPTTAGQVIRGILVASDTIERTAMHTHASGDLGYPVMSAGVAPAAMPSYAIKGIVAVRTAEAVTKGGAVTCVITAGNTQGRFATTANAAQIACPTTWEWHTSAASGAIGLILMR